MNNLLSTEPDSLLTQLKGKIRVMENEVDLYTQLEYTGLMAIMQILPTAVDVPMFRKMAFDHRASVGKRKYMMVALSRSGDVETLRSFERYAASKKCPPDMRSFVLLCASYCRTNVES